MKVNSVPKFSTSRPSFGGILVKRLETQSFDWGDETSYDMAYYHTHYYDYFPFKDESYNQIKKVERELNLSAKPVGLVNDPACSAYQSYEFVCKENLPFTKAEYDEFIAAKGSTDNNKIDSGKKINLNMEDFLRIGNAINLIKQSEKTVHYDQDPIEISDDVTFELIG